MGRSINLAPVKKSLACFLSLVLVWMQATFALGTVPTIAERAACRCCDCGGSGCCVSESAPESQPLPAIPPAPGYSTQVWLRPSPAPAWPLSATESLQFSSSRSLSLTTIGVPLFTRHCALLI